MGIITGLLLFLLTSLSLRGEVDAEQTTSPQEKDQTVEQPNEPSLPSTWHSAEHAVVKTFLKDEVHIWTSPFRGSSYSSRAFPKYVIPFTLITGALIATDHRTSELLPNTRDQAIWSRRVSQVGAPYTLAGMALTIASNRRPDCRRSTNRRPRSSTLAAWAFLRWKAPSSPRQIRRRRSAPDRERDTQTR